ncbi:hypothetical protein H0H87_004708 [Tephrocybe sp. NHM501043]|nr:hypothetical protein H0H87_004708 [Tephrocybe sp. NHM501043]
MAECFPYIVELALLAQRVSKLELADIKQIISPLRELFDLDINKWYDDKSLELVNLGDITYAIRRDANLSYAKDWESVCPSLRRIELFSCTLKKEGSDWVDIRN